MSIRARASTIENKRSFAGHIEELDCEVLTAMLNNIEHKEQKNLRHIATGGFWANDQLEDIQGRDCKCQHCNGQAEGPSHVLWNCPCINEYRQIKHLSNIDASKLPPAMQNGLPLEMSWKLDKTFWGEDSYTGTTEANGNE